MKMKRTTKYFTKLTLTCLLFSNVSPIFADTIGESLLETEDQIRKEEVSEPDEIFTHAPESTIDREFEEPSLEISVPIQSSEEATPDATTDASESDLGSSMEESNEMDTQPTQESSEMEMTTSTTTQEQESSTTESTNATENLESGTSTSENTPVSSESTEATENSSSDSQLNSNSTTESKPTMTQPDSSSVDTEIPTNNNKPSKEGADAQFTHPTSVFPSVSRPLDSNLKAASFVASDLNGFELPLLHMYQDEREAAVVIAALNYLNTPYHQDGTGPDQFNNLNFPRYLYSEIFSLDSVENFDDFIEVGTRVAVEKSNPGDLLVWEKEQRVGIYLGQDKFIMADDTLLNEQEKIETLTDEERAAIPGVRIFTLHQTLAQESEHEDQDLLARYDSIGSPDYGVAKNSDFKLSTEGQRQLQHYPATFRFQENQATLDFIDQISESARELGQQYDVFASVLIAQAILESGAGSSGLSRAPYYNLFGIKGSNSGSSVMLPTSEDAGNGELYQINAAFRVYPDYQASLEDYIQLIRSGISGAPNFYQATWRSNAKNYLNATAELTGKYATDTFYYNKLNSIIATYHLTRFDEPQVAVGQAMLSFSEIPLEYRHKIRFPEYNGQNYNTSGSYGSDQCTWYVYNRVSQLGGQVSDYMGNGADWYTTGLKEGYRTSNIPKVGYVISFKQGVAGYHPLYGHVGFVEAIGDEGILISEGDASYVSYRIIPNEIALSSGVGYLAPQ